MNQCLRELKELHCRTQNLSSGSSLQVKRIQALHVPVKMVQELCLEVFGLIFNIKRDLEFVVIGLNMT
jgi:hypothetical protein